MVPVLFRGILCLLLYSLSRSSSHATGPTQRDMRSSSIAGHRCPGHFIPPSARHSRLPWTPWLQSFFRLCTMPKFFLAVFPLELGLGLLQVLGGGRHRGRGVESEPCNAEGLLAFLGDRRSPRAVERLRRWGERCLGRTACGWTGPP